MDYLLIEDLKLQIQDIRQEMKETNDTVLLLYLQDKINDLKGEIRKIESELKNEKIEIYL